MGSETTKTLTDLQRVRDQRTVDASQPTEDRLQGRVLGRYVVLYRVGSGGMGVVFAAYDPELDRKVAVKVLKRRGKRSGAPELARLEAQAMARLTHPNVVTVHDVGSHGDELFIAMEFIAGRTLKDWLAEDQPAWQQIVEQFVSAGRGLAAAHRAGLVHRDFKPSNVMLSDDGEIKVLDFGLAEYLSQKEDSEGSGIASSRRHLVGTLAYLPPERLRGGDGDARSDQFSFCAALWQALFGILPFPVDEPKDYLQSIRRAQPRESTGRSIPGWLRQALLKGLSLEPEERFPSLEELLTTISPGQRLRRKRRRQGIFAALASVVLLTFLFFWSRGPETNPCGPFDDHLQGIWDTARKSDINTAFSATGVTFAESAWQNTSKILDAYSASWLNQRVEACEATHLRQEQSETLLDQRMVCLDRHFETFRALSQALAEANASTVIDAVRAASSLESLAECRDRSQLARQSPIPQDPAQRQAIERIRSIVESQLARQRFHRVPDLELMRRTVSDAKNVEYPPIHARALYALGWLEGQSGLRRQGVQHLVKAAQIARIAADFRQEIQAYTALVKLESSSPIHVEAAEMWLDFASTQLQVLGPGHEEMEFEVADAAGSLAFARNAPDQAEHWARALELAEQVWGQDSPRIASVLANLSLLGSVESETYLRRAIHVIESWYGVEHPALARPLSHLAVFEAERGHYLEAIHLAHRALQTIPTGEGQDGVPKRAYPLTLLAQLYNATDHPEKALECLTEASKHLTHSLDPEEDLRLRHSLARTRSELLLGSHQGADQSLEVSARLLREARQAVPLAHRLKFASQRAQVLSQRGKKAQAKTLHQEILAALDSTDLQDDDRAQWLLNAAEFLVSEGEFQQAYPLTRQALQLTHPQRDPLRAARGHFAAARCLWPEDPITAQLRAEQAQQWAQGNETPRRLLRQEIERWLEQRGSPKT